MVQFGKMIQDGIFSNATATYENNILDIKAPLNSSIINFYNPSILNQDVVVKVNGVIVNKKNILNEVADISNFATGSPIKCILDNNNNLYFQTYKSL